MGGRARIGAAAAIALATGLVLLGAGVSPPPAGGRQIIGTSPTTETVPTTDPPATTEPAPTTVTTDPPPTTEPTRAPATTEAPAAATTVERTTTTGVPRTLPSTTVALPPPQLPVRSATTQPTPFVLDDDTRLPPAFALVGGLGLLATGGLLATQWVLTRPGRRRRTL